MATEALRRVVDLTGEQLRGLPLGTAPDERAGQAATLRGVVDRGQGQLDTARHLDDLVCRALEEVSATPLTQISVSQLQAVQARIQAQVEALHTIIASAHAQAATVEQVQHLDRVIAEHQQRVRDLRLESAGSEAVALATAGESIVQRLGELDEAAPAQLGALNRIGHAVADQVSESGGTPEQKAETLEHLAQNMQDRADDLRRDPE